MKTESWGERLSRVAGEIHARLGPGLPREVYSHALRQALSAEGDDARPAQVVIPGTTETLAADLLVPGECVVLLAPANDTAERRDAVLRQFIEHFGTGLAVMIDFGAVRAPWMGIVAREAGGRRRSRPDARKGAERLAGVPPRV